MVNPATNTDNLRSLLERLYPDIYISNTSVALVAARIAELDDRFEFAPDQRVDLNFQMQITARAGESGRREF